MRADLASLFRLILIAAASVFLGFVVLLPFSLVLSGGAVDPAPFRVLGTVLAVCLYGLATLAGIGFRGGRRRASLLSSTVVGLSSVGLLTAVFAIWSGFGPDPENAAYARWIVAGTMAALTCGAVAVGLLRSSLERLDP
jgi:hypothetical protein